MGKRNEAHEFASDPAGKPPEETVIDPTRVDAVHPGLEEEADGETLFHRIVTDIFRIGRDPECNLVIKADTKTSRRHATILRRGEEYVLQDNGSSNGTYVNDARLTGPHALQVGDKVKIGKHDFRFTRRPQAGVD
jgi:pSer/pThr/pTyr-binding forkhead associated (FHA) protein